MSINKQLFNKQGIKNGGVAKKGKVTDFLAVLQKEQKMAFRFCIFIFLQHTKNKNKATTYLFSCHVHEEPRKFTSPCARMAR